MLFVVGVLCVICVVVCVVCTPRGVFVAQWIRHPPTKREIAGSSPVEDFCFFSSPFTPLHMPPSRGLLCAPLSANASLRSATLSPGSWLLAPGSWLLARGFLLLVVLPVSFSLDLLLLTSFAPRRLCRALCLVPCALCLGLPLRLLHDLQSNWPCALSSCSCWLQACACFGVFDLIDVDVGIGVVGLSFQLSLWSWCWSSFFGLEICLISLMVMALRICAV